MEFKSTNLPHNIANGLYHEKGYEVGEVHIDKIFYTLFFGVANLLKDNKSQEAPATFIINDIKGKPIAFATVEYYPGEGDNPGNWSMVWSFDVNDIPEKGDKFDLQNDHTHVYFRTIAGEKFSMKFYDRTCIVTLLTYCVEQLYKWLDENAKENEVVEIELDGVFNAKVQIVDGKKEFAIDPMGEVKTIIKDDASSEK